MQPTGRSLQWQPVSMADQHWREPTAIDRMDAEALASLAYQASKLREKGQSELEVWTTYARVRDGSAWATWPINPTYQKPALKRD
jgi:hypothetical protein